MSGVIGQSDSARLKKLDLSPETYLEFSLRQSPPRGAAVDEGIKVTPEGKDREKRRALSIDNLFFPDGRKKRIRGLWSLNEES